MPSKSGAARPKSSKSSNSSFPDPRSKYAGRRRGSSRKKSAVIPPAEPEPTVDELKSELQDERLQSQNLRLEVESLRNQLEDLQKRFDDLSKENEKFCSIIFENADEWKFEKHRIPPVEVNHEKLLDMLNDICYTAHHPPPTEIRMEEMETRITSQNERLVKLLANTHIYENALEDIFQTRDVEYIHDKVADAFLQTDYRFTEAVDYIEDRIINASEYEHNDKVMKDTPLTPGAGIAHSPEVRVLPPRPVTPVHLRRLMERMKDIYLKPPPYRQGGDTHITEMNIDLKRYICRDLNMEKKSGSDWRMLATRVGIDLNVVQSWQREKLVSPMQRVLSVWSQSDHATVRMLHRHLTSPHMKCHLLGRRIEDFYVVE